MWWYIAFSIIFTIYAVDLVFLFVASLFATVTEYFVPPLSTAATRAHKQQQKRNGAKQQQQAAVAKAQVEASKDVVGGGKGDLSIVVDTRAHEVHGSALDLLLLLGCVERLRRACWMLWIDLRNQWEVQPGALTVQGRMGRRQGLRQQWHLQQQHASSACSGCAAVSRPAFAAVLPQAFGGSHTACMCCTHPRCRQCACISADSSHRQDSLQARILTLLPATPVLMLQNGVPESPVKPVANDYSYLTDLYHGEYPKVLIQLPMYNEDAHCDLIVTRCCKIKWPSHRILIQVGIGILAGTFGGKQWEAQ